MSFTPLFAARASWLIVVGGLVALVFIAWFLFRVVVDTVSWFREEIIEDYQHRKQQTQQPQDDRPEETGPEDDSTTDANETDAEPVVAEFPTPEIPDSEFADPEPPK